MKINQNHYVFGHQSYEKTQQQVQRKEVSVSDITLERKLLDKQEEISLSNFYSSESIGTTSPSKLVYFHSLVPNIESLKRYRKIRFLIGLALQRPKTRLLPENSVNIHLFKPFYIEPTGKETDLFGEEQTEASSDGESGPEFGETQNTIIKSMKESLQIDSDSLSKAFADGLGGTITCFVPTREIMKHAMAALFQTHAFHQLPQPMISCCLHEESVHELIAHWNLKQRLLLCRVESLITYLLIEWLHEVDASREIIQGIVLEIEYSRLTPKYPSFDACLEEVLKNHGFDSTKLFQRFSIVRQHSHSPFLYGFNFIYRGEEISAVMLPWGLQLASRLMKALLGMTKALRVGVVGGIGYVGEECCEVDDIFVPTSMFLGDASNYCVKPIENGILGSPQAVLFAGHRTVQGCMKSVFPECGKLSNIAVLKPVLHKVDALDMEFEALYRSARQAGAQVGAVYYVMDLPRLGVHLGDTYYSRPFLDTLFRKFARGKHHCFERALGFLAK